MRFGRNLKSQGITGILKMHLSSNNKFGIKLLPKNVICLGLPILLTFQISKRGIKIEMWPSNSLEPVANSWMPTLWHTLLIKSLGRWQRLEIRDNNKLFSMQTMEVVSRVNRPIFSVLLGDKSRGWAGWLCISQTSGFYLLRSPIISDRP